MGLLHLYRGSEGFDPDQLSEEELRPWKAYKTALGELTPIVEVLPVWLETIGNKKTRSDYRRAVEVLAQRFTTLEELDRRKAKQFLEWAKREKQDHQSHPSQMDEWLQEPLGIRRQGYIGMA